MPQYNISISILYFTYLLTYLYFYYFVYFLTYFLRATAAPIDAVRHAIQIEYNIAISVFTLIIYLLYLTCMPNATDSCCEHSSTYIGCYLFNVIYVELAAGLTRWLLTACTVLTDVADVKFFQSPRQSADFDKKCLN